jgi:hypothetical protein
MSSRQWVFKSQKLLLDEKLASVVTRLMIVMNDIGITNSQMFEWERTEDKKKKARWRGAVLYFGRIQSAHLFEALDIIAEIKKDRDLLKRVERCDPQTMNAFETVAAFVGTDDYRLMAKMRNVAAFHYDPKLTLRRLKSLVEKYPEHVSGISMGSETLDWYFELGDLIVDGIVVRDVFEIGEQEDIRAGALKVLDRLHVIGEGLTNFAGHFIRHCCKK